MDRTGIFSAEDKKGTYFQAEIDDYIGNRYYYDQGNILSVCTAKSNAKRQAEFELNRRHLKTHPITVIDMINLYVPPKWNPSETWNPKCNPILKRVCDAQR